MRAAVLLLPLAVLGGCKQSPPQAAAPEAAASSTPSAAPAPPPPAKPRAVTEENAAMSFSYSYPATAAAIPELAALLDADLAEARAETIDGAKEMAAADREAGIERGEMQYSHSTEWKVVTDLPGWLSLTADRYEFTGGAHGNPWSDALLWDKAAKVRRTAIDLFTSPAALRAAIGPAFCQAIDRQREKKRGEPVDPNSGMDYDKCLDPTDYTVILGSSDRRHFDRIGVIVSPYNAGPYAEGFYEVTLPVTAAVLKAVEPRYRKDFALGR